MDRDHLHSILFVASFPDRDIDWEAFTQEVDKKVSQARNVARLAENVWMIDLTISVAPLGWLVAVAEQKAISHGLLPFDDEPRWLPVGFDPKTIRGQIGR